MSTIADFIARAKRAQTKDAVQELMDRVSNLTAGRTLSDTAITTHALSMESLDPTTAQVLSTAYNGIETALTGMLTDKSISVEAHQVTAASMSGIMSANTSTFMRSPLKVPAGAVGQFQTIRPETGDGTDARAFSVALEAYDERDNRNAQQYSIMYNLLASRQDDFGEAWYPTLVVNPTEVGILLEVKLFLVYNDFKRSITGALAAYNRKNVIRAYADATILNNELTYAVPVLRITGGADDTTANFVPTSGVGSVPATTFTTDGLSIPTAPLKTGREIDLIGLSQTDALIANGLMDVTDNLDSLVKLEAIYIKFYDGINTNVVKFDMSQIPDSMFTYAPQANTRKMLLNVSTSSVIITAATVPVDGGTLTALSQMTAGMVGRLNVNLAGYVILDKGNLVINGGAVSLQVLRDATGALLTPNATLAANIATATIIGYDVKAHRANSNLRQRGQLVDTQRELQVINIPYRSPVACVMPVTDNSGNDSSALQTLVTITSVRISNEAVTALLKAQSALVNYTSVPDVDGTLPNLFGIGRYYIKPVYFTEAVNLTNTVDSLRSMDRIKDIRCALVEKLRYYASEMYRSSEYKAAALVLNGNINFKPTLVVGTDPVVYNYLMADGDLRTLGEQFDVKIVSSIDTRISNKIFMSFGVFDTSRNSVVNPLSFGNLLWSPESTVVLPISRNGQISKEMIVAPRFYHMTNLPIMTVLTLTNLPAMTNKIVALNSI